MGKLRNYIFYAFIIICLIAGISGGYSWYYPNERIIEKWHKAEAPEIITKIQKVEVPIEKIVVIEKEKADKELNLPDEIVKDEGKEILAIVEIPPYEGKTTALAVLDKSTKETEINIRHERRAFIGLESVKILWLKAGYGFKDNGLGYNVEVGGEWQFLRIGNVHFGLFGQADINRNIFAGVKASYKW